MVVLVAMLAFVVGAYGGPSTNAPRPFISSTAGQFHAFSTEAAWSSVLCVLGSEVKREWLKRLNLPDKWRDPIVLVVAERSDSQRDAPACWLEILRTDLHLKFQIQLRVPPPLPRAEVVRALVQALCSEYANRELEFRRQPHLAATVVPPWLVEGLSQSIAGEQDKLLGILRRGLHSGAAPMVEELLTATAIPSDDAGRLRFQAYSWVLVEALLSLPSGAEKLCQLMREPGRFSEIYRWQFDTDAAREKWWSLQITERGSALVAADWSAAETGRRLAAILPSKLQMQLPDAVAEAPVAFADLGRYTEKKWLAPLARDKLAQLAALRGTAHPLYRDAIDHYAVALQYLLAGSVSRFRHETRLAQRAHAAADEQTRKISEYVDQVERVYAPSNRAALQRAMNLLDATQEMNILRRDPISDYLDQFDR